MKKNTIRIYRIENKRGVGIFRSCAIIYQCINTMIENYARNKGESYFEFHPLPESDYKLQEQLHRKYLKINRCVFGFETKEQILSWFPSQKVKNYINKERFYVYIYEVDVFDCAIGNTQVCFLKNKSRQVGRLSILEL